MNRYENGAPTAPDWLAGYEARVRAAGVAAERTGRELAALTASATSPDGSVTATVDHTGALRELVLTERTAGMGRRELATAVVATATRAREDVTRAAETMAATVLAPLPRPGAGR